MDPDPGPGPAAPAGGAQRKVYRVAEITRLIRAVLEEEFGSVWIEGEISNLRRPASGHCYFTLKDAQAQIRAVLFAGAQRQLACQLADGLQVRIYGQISVYERSGEYQVIARLVEPAGQGALQEAFEKLKKKLQAEGLFDPARKRKLPLLPQRIGIVTSPTGAAIRDILKILAGRFPNLHVMIVPAKVQGDGAAAEIAAGIDLLNARNAVDVIIAGRGGGSLEDLWCFNEEVVARAIARSAIPVISAVGHEIDFTISDFVADVRAPTPTAAAELVVGQKDQLEAALCQCGQRLRAALDRRRLELRNRLTRVAHSYVFREPRNLAQRSRRQLAEYLLKLRHAGLSRVNSLRQRGDELALRAAHALGLRREQTRLRLQRLEAQLRALGPQAVLERGYSITRRPGGAVVRDASQVRTGDVIQTHLARGTLRATVQESLPTPTEVNP